MKAGVTAWELVGREHELQRIHEFLERAANAPAALVLEGEPGIGKTTLWNAGVELAREDGRQVLLAQPAEAERDLSFSALGDLLDPALGRLEALSAPRRRALETALLIASDEDRAPDALAVGLATRDLLRLLAEEHPLLVALDDTQWLDQASRETLAYALRRVERGPIGLLTACRPGAEVFALGEPEALLVEPLSIEALQQLLSERPAAAMTRPTLMRIYEASGGNPFFALELARALKGRELRPGEPLPVPATLGELTASRVEQLGPDAREVLLYAAALARPTAELVSEATGEGAGAALEEAIAEGIIEDDGSRLRFTHPLLASVHYGSATPDERERTHRRLAEVVNDAEERGRHLGAATTTPDASVAEVLDAAASAARARGAPWAAAELADVALHLTPANDEESVLRRLRAAADHHFTAGSTARARELLEQALSESPRGPARARVALELATVLDSQNLVAERPLLARALHEAGSDLALRAEIHHQLAYYALMDIDQSRPHAHLAHRLAERTGDAELITKTLALAVDRDFWAGEGIDHDLIRRGIALEPQAPDLGLHSRPTSVYAFVLDWSGEIRRAAPLWEQLRSLGRSRGGMDLNYILYYSSLHELVSEDWEQAARDADEAWTLAIDAERDVDAGAIRWGRAIIAAYRGNTEEARSEAAEAHRLSAAAGDPDPFFAGWGLGVLELSLNEPTAALAQLRPATEEKVPTGKREPGLMLGFPEHVEAAVLCGELDEAAELLDFVEEHARRLDRAWALGCCARGRGLLAAARGHDQAAETAFARAYEQHARRPQQLPTYELARTLLVHGSILRRRQRKRQAREALEQALAIFERLGSAAYARRTRSELARIGGRSAAAGDELSETERRIAELTAQGLSNKEVAAELSLSPKTVEWNLSKVYAKLGIRSRTELARRWR
jgi:DNA-binding CsgD family transcriptional regulator